jgi:hypothetical protein
MVEAVGNRHDDKSLCPICNSYAIGAHESWCALRIPSEVESLQAELLQAELKSCDLASQAKEAEIATLKAKLAEVERGRVAVPAFEVKEPIPGLHAALNSKAPPYAWESVSRKKEEEGGITSGASYDFIGVIQRLSTQVAALMRDRDEAVAEMNERADRGAAEFNTLVAAGMDTHGLGRLGALKALVAARDAFRTSVDKANADIDEMAEQRDEARTQRDAAEKECKTLRAQVEALKSASRDDRTRHGNALAECGALKAELARVTTERDDANRDWRCIEMAAGWMNSPPHDLLHKDIKIRLEQLVVVSQEKEALCAKLSEDRAIIRELRQKLAIAGVEGSPPPGETTTIGALLERARTSEARVTRLEEVLDGLTYTHCIRDGNEHHVCNCSCKSVRRVARDALAAKGKS